MLKNIYLIVAPSGTGKDALVDKLEGTKGYKRLCSYTTRESRGEGDKHIFISGETFDKLENICAFVKYNNHRYCATSEQVDDSDLYIIDPEGVKYFKATYKGSKKAYVIGLRASREVREERMRLRGDSEKNVQERLQKDDTHFRDYCSMCDCVVDNIVLSDTVESVDKFIKMCEEPIKIKEDYNE